VARYCFPTAKIISFEPLAEPAAIYRRIFAKDEIVRLHETAIGTNRGEATIHISKDDDSSSILPITTLQKQLFPETEEVGTALVKVGFLTDYVSSEEIVPAALFKLDVQGYELDVLRGCEEMLCRFAWVYVECSFVELYQGQAMADEVIAWLRERKFVFCGVYNTIYNRLGKAIQADFLFKSKSLSQNHFHR
jgi:FkbM family methyltransferase